MLKKQPFLFLVFSFLFMILMNCDSKKTEQKKVTTVQKPIPKKRKKSPRTAKKEKELDTINNKNTVEFLKAYGKENPETIVIFETRLGNIKVRLYKDTPLHRANFIFLTKTGYFNTACFHRIIPGFIIQGGNSDHPATRKLRNKYKNYTIPAEMKSHRTHKYGALAAAREWEHNPKKRSSAFEFYMIQDKQGSHHLEGEHTVFGEIIQGFATMKKIASLRTDKKEWPLVDVFIKAKVIQ